MEGNSQVKESELAWVTPKSIDESTGEIAAKDGSQVVIRNLYRQY